MQPVIKIRKRNENLKPVDPPEAPELTERESSREVARTVKGWVAEWQQRRKELVSHSLRVSLLVLLCFLVSPESSAQHLREAFRKVEQSVVVIRTNQKNLAPFPEKGMVSLNGLGSGVLISENKVLTAAHLVQSADKTIVEFSDGELIAAQVAGSTMSADIALLQLERAPTGAAAVLLGDSDRVAVGDQIFVVGAPYGLSRTLSVGHISGRHALNKRSERGSSVEFLQTDAAINTGNSGSPVFNLDGEVVGIISNILSRSGGSEGLAFASASNTVRRALLEQKPFWSGIEGVLVEGDLARALNLPQAAGLLVQRVAEGSIAWRWGIRPGKLRASVEGEELLLGGDIILALNEVSVERGGTTDEIYASVNQVRAGDNLIIKVFRRGQTLTLSVPLGP